MLTCNLGANKINCFDGSYTKDQLKMWSKKGILLCEACGKPYEYCHGRVVLPYFRHKDKNLCEDKYSETETEEHIQGKRDLYEWLKKQDGVTDVELEAWIPETKQRPDIKFKYNGKICVMEYQCSPIATEYYERHELYQAAGINDIWICGTEKYLKDGMRYKVLLKECHVMYDSSQKIFLFDLCGENSIDFNKYHMLRSYINRSLYIQKHFKRYFELAYFQYIQFDGAIKIKDEYNFYLQQKMTYSQMYKNDEFCDTIDCKQIAEYFNRKYSPLHILVVDGKADKRMRIYYSLYYNQTIVVSDDFDLRRMYPSFDIQEVYNVVDEYANEAIKLINSDLLQYYTKIANHYHQINSVFNLYFIYDHKTNVFEMHCTLKNKFSNNHYCNFVAFSVDSIIDMQDLNKIVNENMNNAIKQWELENKVRFMEERVNA